VIKKVDKNHFFNVCHTLCWTCKNGYGGKCSYIDAKPTDENLAAEINHLGGVALCWKPSSVRKEKHGWEKSSLFKVIKCPRYKEDKQ